MKLSVVVPVYNEQENINSLISHIRQLADCEIVVSDANGETMKGIEDKYVIAINSPKGRANQMNAGAEKASGDVLLFLHADTDLPENFYDIIEKGLANYDAGAFRLEIDDDRPIFRIIEKIVALRNKLTRTPYGDQGIFCTKEAFNSVGGYADIPLMEDVRLMQDFKKRGCKVLLSGVPVRTSARRWQKEGLIYTTLRNWVIISLYYMGVNPSRLKKFYK